MISTHLSLLAQLSDEQHRELAWGIFDSSYRPIIYRWCSQHGLQDADSQDLTQQIMGNLQRKLSLFDPEHGAFRSWLKTVVKNSVYDFLKSRQRSPEVQGVGGTEFLGILNEMDSGESLENLTNDLTEKRHTNVLLLNAIEKTKSQLRGEKTWQAFELTVVHDRPAREVAEQLSISIAAVHQANYRVRKVLAESYLELSREQSN